MKTPQASALAAARMFALDVIAPNAEHWETLGRVPYEAFEQAADAGLCGLLVPESLGGRGLGVGGMAVVMEVLASACMNTAFSFVVHNNLTANIARNGSEAQIDRYVTEMVRGRKIGAFLLTEPGAGSDAQAIATRAESIDGGWRISGEKAWVSNGTFADVLSVYAQTKPGSGARGIASFLVDADAAGVKREDGFHLLRGHALGAGGFSFDACRVDDDMLLHGPGEAFAAAMSGIDTARINVAAMCCGMLAESLACAVDYAGTREAFGQSTLSFQGLQWMLAEVATDLEAARLLVTRAAQTMEAGEEATLAAAHAKKFATRVAFSGVADCMQVMGAAGYRAEYPLARHLAAAKMAQFLDGTTEIQNVVISRALQSSYGRKQGGG